MGNGNPWIIIASKRRAVKAPLKGKRREERGKREGRESEKSLLGTLSHFVFPLPFPLSSLFLP
jgi:hypothetical protein